MTLFDVIVINCCYVTTMRARSVIAHTNADELSMGSNPGIPTPFSSIRYIRNINSGLTS